MKKIAYIIGIIGILIICIGIILLMIDFYNDYKCSTTTDFNYFINNNCQRYIK